MQNELTHHGILGQKWGIRRYQPYPSDYHGDGKYTGKQAKKTQKLAEKDAKRYVNAKMYYGEGAGTRRKLLNAELDRKMKDPVYKEAFDKAVESGNYAQAAQRAKLERGARDTAAEAKRIAKKAVIPTAMLAGSIYYSTHKPEVDSFILKHTENIINAGKQNYDRAQLEAFLRRMGL